MFKCEICFNEVADVYNKNGVWVCLACKDKLKDIPDDPQATWVKVDK